MAEQSMDMIALLKSILANKVGDHFAYDKRRKDVEGLLGGAKGAYSNSPESRAQEAQASMLEEQLSRMKHSTSAKPQRSSFSNMGRASNAGGFSLFNDMMNPNTGQRIREERDEDRIFEKKLRDQQLAMLMRQLESSQFGDDLTREKFDFESAIKRAQEQREKSAFNLKRKSLMEMFG